VSDDGQRTQESAAEVRLSDRQFKELLGFRVSLRRFLNWSEQAAAEAGLTAAQHQLLIAVRGHPDPLGPTITDLAGYLFVRHHSAVGLVDRVEAMGLVGRHRDPNDQRTVRVRLTSAGRERVEALGRSHLSELRRVAPALRTLLSDAT
jgi:DNA-binding MarR family transcriptional regulator